MRTLSRNRALFLLLCLGCFARIFFFFTRGALWGDEAALAMNIAPRSFAQLLEPLEYFQVCPIGFLALSKCITLLFGDGEGALRALSLLSGIAVLPLTYFIVERLFDRRVALVAVALAAVAPSLVYYSAELKPYSTDAAVAAGVLLLTIQLLSAPDDWRLRAGFLGFGLFAVLVSLPAIFMLGGSVAALLLDAIRRRSRWARLLEISGGGAAFALLFWLHLTVFLSRSSAASAPSVSRFWAQGFAPFPPTTLSDLRWYPAKFFFAFEEPAGLWPRYLAGLLFIGGAYYIYRRHRVFVVALVTPALLMLAASSLGRYPIEPRLILFLVPTMLIGVAASLTAFDRVRPRPKAVVLVALALAVPPTIRTAKSLVPRSGMDVADVAERLEEEVRPTDGFFIDDSMEWPFAYYRYRYDIAVPPVDTRSIPPRYPIVVGERQPYLAHVRTLFGNDRVWFVLSDFVRPERGAPYDQFVTAYVEKHGGRAIQKIRGNGLLFALYDLSDANDDGT